MACCSYYGWGNMKATCTVTHAGEDMDVKGNPKINLIGELIQFGYKIYFRHIVNYCIFRRYVLSSEEK